ncbi:MAG: hypothetical protein QNJ14_02740 [Woeseiaceae bacterium]|nr:hypothetical protein [Woeseiaceae bacterium]
MRHAILVVGSEAQRSQGQPKLVLRNDEPVRSSTWFASTDQQNPVRLLDDSPSFLVRLFLAPLLAYRFYLLVHNTKLWAGKRPLILVRGRGLSSRVAAYSGHWGGGDVVMADQTDEAPLGPTRFVLTPDGSLKLHDGNS